MILRVHAVVVGIPRSGIEVLPALDRERILHDVAVLQMVRGDCNRNILFGFRPQRDHLLKLRQEAITVETVERSPFLGRNGKPVEFFERITEGVRRLHHLPVVAHCNDLAFQCAEVVFYLIGLGPPQASELFFHGLDKALL